MTMMMAAIVNGAKHIEAQPNFVEMRDCMHTMLIRTNGDDRRKKSWSNSRQIG